MPIAAALLCAGALAVTGLANGAAGPKRGETILLKRVAGTVKFRAPEDKGFKPLESAALVPVKTVVDAIQGTVRVTSARGSSGDTDSGFFRAGRFMVRQPDVKGAKTTAVLRGKVSESCSSGHQSRRLVARAHKPFRTRGIHASAAAIGTTWLQKDSCSGTTTAVRAGTGVAVRDFRTGDRIILHAGEKYRAH